MLCFMYKCLYFEQDVVFLNICLIINVDMLFSFLSYVLNEHIAFYCILLHIFFNFKFYSP
jgi:hypothetical protein